MTAAKVSHIGGRMYGDGEYVVSFENVGSSWAPMQATVIGDGVTAEVDVPAYATAPSVKLAAEIIAAVRREIGRAEQ